MLKRKKYSGDTLNKFERNRFADCNQRDQGLFWF